MKNFTYGIATATLICCFHIQALTQHSETPVSMSVGIGLTNLRMDGEYLEKSCKMGKMYNFSYTSPRAKHAARFMIGISYQELGFNATNIKVDQSGEKIESYQTSFTMPTLRLKPAIVLGEQVSFAFGLYGGARFCTRVRTNADLEQMEELAEEYDCTLKTTDFGWFSQVRVGLYESSTTDFGVFTALEISNSIFNMDENTSEFLPAEQVRNVAGFLSLGISF